MKSEQTNSKQETQISKLENEISNQNASILNLFDCLSKSKIEIINLESMKNDDEKNDILIKE